VVEIPSGRQLPFPFALLVCEILCVMLDFGKSSYERPFGFARRRSTVEIADTSFPKQHHDVAVDEMSNVAP
jgi:hypothetical protein